MKLPLRYFILACLLLGAIGVPWAWRTYQARREKAAKIQRLEKELAELWANDPDPLYIESHDPRFRWPLPELKRWANQWEHRVRSIEDRLEKLTGKRPERLKMFDFEAAADSALPD